MLKEFILKSLEQGTKATAMFLYETYGGKLGYHRNHRQGQIWNQLQTLEKQGKVERIPGFGSRGGFGWKLK